ncbi:MAG: hypothetical protein AAF682_16735 [Planctomycetota bacterium]
MQNRLPLCLAAVLPLAASFVSSAQDRSPDPLKLIIEQPIKEALKRSVGLGPAELPPPHEAWKPGDVAWHGSYEEALAAAAESGRPVLLFQLFGRLDEAFC